MGILYGEICFGIRVIQDTSKVAERIKLSPHSSRLEWSSRFARPPGANSAHTVIRFLNSKKLVDVYDEKCMDVKNVGKWCREFSEGRENVHDEHRSGRPSLPKSTIARTMGDLTFQYTLTLALMSEAYEDEKLSRTQVYFWYKRFKDGRKSIADDSRLITGDETWCFLFVPQTKKQSLKWHTQSSPRRKKVSLDKSKGKVMLVVFFDYQGLVYYEFIKEGVTINKQTYKEILVRLRDTIRRKRNKLFKSKQWKLLHDNAPARRAIIVQDYLAKHSVCLAASSLLF
ncbi:hypothetical protein LAZ67_6002052 [Cordylochernes scorpioides]|uniref:Transposase n=1 Tax=Cordylochernes scorpioides TaxID=51811 RepID=A0ABY6KKU4_9ARAC|nr:hypothetical protein LAZ67_6002052 [Cordylochernes scorpioides]